MGKKILLALGSFILCLLLAEVVLRLLGMAPGINRLEIDLPHGTFQSSLNPVLRYEPRPGSRNVSSYGIRDLDYDIQKPAGTYRILVIGDSIGYGYCHDGDYLMRSDLFMEILEEDLPGQTQQDIEVINLCVSGYDTVQEVEFLVEKGLVLEPDLVLVSYCLNDDFDASMELRYFDQSPQFTVVSKIGQKLFLKSHLARMLMLSTFKPEPRALPARPVSARPVPEAVSRTERGFQRLHELALEHDFQTLIVVFPLFEKMERYRWLPLHQRVAATAHRFQMPVLDLLGPFNERTGGDLRKLQGRCNREHPDERGHRAAAEIIEQYLLENRVLVAH